MFDKDKLCTSPPENRQLGFFWQSCEDLREQVFDSIKARIYLVKARVHIFSAVLSPDNC